MKTTFILADTDEKTEAIAALAKTILAGKGVSYADLIIFISVMVDLIFKSRVGLEFFHHIYSHLGFEITDEQVADIGGGFVMDDYIQKGVSTGSGFGGSAICTCGAFWRPSCCC